MRARPLAVLGVCAALLTTVQAQPHQGDPLTGTPNGSPGGTTKIPIASGSTEVLDAEGSGASSPAPTISVEQPIDPNTFVCGPGDVFELHFWGQQNFRLRISVDLEGRTFISKVGFVPVAGKTLATVRADIKKRVKANYPGLQFDLTLSNPRTFVVHLANNVKQPGAVTATAVDRVSTVLTRAGGSTTTGSRRRIVVRRHNGDETKADLLLYEQTGRTEYNPFVLDGDVIVVPNAETTITITGAVHRPGRYELVGTKDVAEAISLAGGLTTGVARKLPLRITRRNEAMQQKFVELTFSGTSTPNGPLQDQDIVQIPSSDEVQPSVLLMGAIVGADTVDTTTTSKRLAYVQGDTVRSLIDRAGGIRTAGDLKRAYISRATPGKPPEFIPVDLEALFARRDFSADRKVQINDTIVVPPIQHSVTVEGAVTRSGPYPYNPQFTITEYIARAGGRTRIAKSIDDVKLIDTNGTTRSFKPGLKPGPGDSILVPERNFTRAEIVQLVLAGAGLVLSAVTVTLAASR